MAREIRTRGLEVSMEVHLYDTCKYSASGVDFDRAKIIDYTDVTEWHILTGEEAAEAEALTDGSCIDDLHEYLEIHMSDGSVATFRNSYVDMFIGKNY